MGDRVVFDGAVHRVVALAGTSVRLVDQVGGEQVVLLPYLVGAADFELVDHDPAPARVRVRDGLLDDLPAEAAEAARRWERHVLEVETGLAPDAPPGSAVCPQYDPARALAERARAKAAELTALGEPISVRTVQRMRRRYRVGGVRALVDGRSLRYPAPGAGADPRLVEVLEQAMSEEAEQSTGTRDRLRHRVQRILAERFGAGAVAMPSKATFNRLVARLDAGRHTFGAASTRRSLAARPQGPYTVSWAARPGALVLIDATPLDVLALFDDGIARRIDLLAAVDVATRTICAAVLRPAGTKAVDASLLLARMLVPEPMRPGWCEVAAMTASRLPHRTLAEIDERMNVTAAKPVIVPEVIGCDRGKVFLSETFLAACRHLGISVQPSRPRTGSDDAVIERTFHSINTLFCQYVRGYVGREWPTAAGISTMRRAGRSRSCRTCWISG